MKSFRLHRHIWLAWGSWWAIQVAPQEWLQLGFHAEPRRPLLDLFLGPVTIAFGRHPVLTAKKDIHRHGGRGFVAEGAASWEYFQGYWPEDAIF